MTVLTLQIKREWFDKIESGEKKEEYREIKPYFDNRLFSKEYTHLRLINGFARNINGRRVEAPRLLVEIKSIKKGLTKQKWANKAGQLCYVIALGEIIQQK